MKCKQCAKEIHKDAERQYFNDKHGGKPTYDEMGFEMSQICLDCIDKNAKKLINETKCYTV